jgi:riboflavin kinase/FMN adenylyltransferase
MNKSKPAVLSIGNFDGLHLGHRHLLAQVCQRARSLSAQSLIVSFYPHPLEVLKPEKAPLRIFDLETQAQQIKKLGIDQFIRLPFDQNFSALTADEFFNEYILKRWQTCALYVGYDFRFGKDRAGNASFLKEKCHKNNIEFFEVGAFHVENEIVSSSRIRQLLEVVDLQLVERYLGQKFFLQGHVIKGLQKGRQLHFPTANLQLATEMRQLTPLKMGVYSVQVELPHGVFAGVMNIGFNPTVSNQKHLKIEAHIFNFSDDIYGKEMKLIPLRHLRDEKKFSSLTELESQIRLDVLNAKKDFE